MKAIIPVAGKGNRFLPHTQKFQKCLLPVAGRPILEHILTNLTGIVDEIILVVGHYGSQVIEYTKRNEDFTFRFIEQKEQLGLGHAIYLGLEDTDEPVLILLGDALYRFDINEFIATSYCNVGVCEVSDPQRYGIVETSNDHFITKVTEKPAFPKSNLAMIGAYYFTSQLKLRACIDQLIENAIVTKGEYQLTDALQIMLNSGENISYQIVNENLFMDCGTLESLLFANRSLLLESNNINISANIQESILKSCTISEGCQVNNSKLENVIMLKNSHVSGITLKDTVVGFNEIMEKTQIINVV